MVFKFGKETAPLYSLCKLYDETIVHLFHDSLIDKNIWNQLKFILLNNLSFPLSAPQCAIERTSVQNHLRLFFKIYIDNARITGYLNIDV